MVLIFETILFSIILLLLWAVLTIVFLIANFFHRKFTVNAKLGFLAKSFYFLPALTILWIGFAPQLPMSVYFFIGTQLSIIKWIILELFVAYLGWRYLARAEMTIKPNILNWLKALPGWGGAEIREPADKLTTVELSTVVALPTLSALVSVIDVVIKTGTIFPEVSGYHSTKW